MSDNFDALVKAPQFAKPPLDVPEEGYGEYIDGRSARRTGRTVQFATVVSPEFKAWIKSAAAEQGKSQAALLDDMKAAYLELCGRSK